MAGSLKWFVYTTDAGDDFAIYRDESNLEAVNAGTQDYVAATPVTYALPNNVKPRTLTYANQAGTVRRNIIALTPTIFNGVARGSTITDAVSGQTLSFVRKNGENVRIPFAFDTGLTDGDDT